MRRALGGLTLAVALFWSAAAAATTYTIFSDAADGSITSSNAVYLTARSGSGLLADAGAAVAQVGQVVVGDYFCKEIFLSWDTSPINDAETISSALISLYGSANDSTADFTFNIRSFDWGATLTTADWVAGASLSGNTLLASHSTASGWSLVAYNDFTSQAGLLTAINKTGSTRAIGASSRQEAGDVPTTDERVTFYSADQAGTTQDPKLVVEASSAANKSMGLLGVGR